MGALDGKGAQTKGEKFKGFLKGAGITLGALALATTIFVGGMHSQEHWVGGRTSDPADSTPPIVQEDPTLDSSVSEKQEFVEVTVDELTADEKLSIAGKLYTGRASSTLDTMNLDSVSVAGTSKGENAQYAYITLDEPTKSGEVSVMYKVAYDLDADLANIAELNPLTTNGKENGPVQKERYVSLDHYLADVDYDNAKTVISEAAEITGNVDSLYVKPNNEMLMDGTYIQGFDYATISTEDGGKVVTTGTLKSQEATASINPDFAAYLAEYAAPKEVVDENTNTNENSSENSTENSSESTNEESSEKTTTTGKFGIIVDERTR